jgi:hypothetical protein
MIVHNLITIYRDIQIPAAGVRKIGLYLNIIIHTSLDWIGVGPEREHRKVAGTVTGIQTRGAISGNNLQMIAIKLDREWGRGGHVAKRKRIVIIVHLSGDKPI